jgi:hypothetical protein
MHAHAARGASSREGSRRQPTEEAPGQPTAIVENDAARDGLAISEHSSDITHEVSKRDMHPPSFRGASKMRTRNLEIPGLVRSLSSGGAKAPTRWDHPGMTVCLDGTSQQRKRGVSPRFFQNPS